MTATESVSKGFETIKTRPLERLLGASIILALALIPLNGIWERTAELLGSPPLILAWVQITLLLFLVVSGLYLGFFRRFFFAWTAIDYCLLIYLLVAGFSYFWSDRTLTEHLTGLRYSALLFIFYFIGRIIGQKSYWSRGARLALTIVAAVALVQLVVWWIYPPSRNWLPLAASDYVGQLPRLRGPFAGANQLATFLVLAWLGAAVFDGSRKSLVVSALITGLILATFSRSALLGLIAALVGVVILLPRYRRVAIGQIAVIAIVTLLLFGLSGLIAGKSFVSPLSRSVSDRGHLELPQGAIEEIVRSKPTNIIIGHGAGTAGPATFSQPNPIIPENWYLQVAYEYGLIGLTAILGFFWTLLRRAYRQESAGLLAMTLAIMINALFLHPLSDNAAVTLLFFLGAGSLLTTDFGPDDDDAKVRK